MTIDKLASYTVADSIPIKLMLNAREVRKFQPVHVQ